MSFVLQFTKTDGSQGEATFKKNTTKIDLGIHDIVEMDLSQLISNNRIKMLDLIGNPIERIDLTPLISCGRLREIVLPGSTEGETILSSGTMEKVSNEAVYDEITNFDALSYLPSLDSVLFSYPYVKKREPDWKLLHLFRSALRSQELGWMGLLDIGIKKIDRYLDSLTTSGFANHVHRELVELLIEQIDRGGTTIDLEVDGMKKHGELVIRIDDVVELRNQEMKQVIVPIMAFAINAETIVLLESVGESIDTHYADLRLLLLTAYGYEVCESLMMGTTCEKRSLPKVTDALSELGFEIPTSMGSETYSVIGWRNREVLRALGVKSPEPNLETPGHISSEMIEYIWHLADYRKSISDE